MGMVHFTFQIIFLIFYLKSKINVFFFKFETTKKYLLVKKLVSAFELVRTTYFRCWYNFWRDFLGLARVINPIIY